jgi:hypothetical protein
MGTMLNDPSARRSLMEKGAPVLSQYSFAKTAAEFQTLYKRTASLYPNHSRPS